MISKENVVSLQMNAADKQAVTDALKVLEQKLLPHLVELTVSEKLALAKMKDKTLAFVTKALEHAEQKKDLVPPYVNVPELRKDLEAVEALRQYNNQLAQVHKALEDTMMLAGSEAYIAALGFYQSVKGAAKVNVPGAQEVFNDLRIRFEKSPRSKPKPE